MAVRLFLDATYVGLACVGPEDSTAAPFHAWRYQRMILDEFCIATVTLYEVRRKLLHLNHKTKLKRLFSLTDQVSLISVTDADWDRAGELLATARRRGRTTAADKALDADALLAATALRVAEAGEIVLIATENVRHLRYFPGVDARRWRDL